MCTQTARERNLVMVPTFHELLVRGVATYGLEFLRAVDTLDTVYVPIGLWSGHMRTSRSLALRLATRSSAWSPEGCRVTPCPSPRKPVATETATIADGLAVRVPNAEAVEVINRFVERVITVSDQEIEEAMRDYCN